MSDLSRRVVLTGSIGLTAAALAGCTGPEPSTTPTATTSTTAPSATPATSAPPPVEVPRWPLTGKLLKNQKDAQHIAVAVKVPDNRNEHPQLGLEKADLVYVQLDGYPPEVGQSSTRLVPVFHSQFPDAVNPVRSIRPVDIPMLSPINPIIGSTGAFPWVQEYADEFADHLMAERFYLASKGTGAYGILRSRVRVLNGTTYYDRAVMCHPTALAALATRFKKGPRQNYFPWADAAEASAKVSGKPAKLIRVPWKVGNTYPMTYTWDAAQKRYLRSEPWGPHILAGGIRVACDNVLVIKNEHVFGKIYKSGRIKTGPGIHAEPLHQIIDTEGTFYYANRGRYVTGTWSKGSPEELFSFTLEDGSPLQMAPGQTYVELPNTNAKVTFN